MGFILLDSNRPYDSGSLLLAEVGDNDVLEAVGDEPLKIEAALLVRGIQRVGVAEDTHLSPADIDAFRSRGLVVERLGDVASAVDFASGLASGLRAYLRKILQAADENPEVYLEPRKPTELYIPLDVLKRVLKPRVPQPESDRKVERGRGELPPPEALDIGEEALWGQRPEETEERVPWEKELNKIRSGDGRMVVLTGPPGSGKTLLARMTAHQIAKQAVQHLEGQTKRVHEVELPIYVRLRDLAQKAGPGGYAKGETGLRRALRDVLSDSGDVVDEVVLNYLFGPEDQVTEPRVGPQGHAAEPRAWLFLDGLDEVERNETLQAWLGVLKNWQCRVVIASRPHGYAGWGPLPFSPTAYRLAPFTEQQAEDFIPKWYASDPSQEQSHESSRDQNRDASREQLIELFRSSQSVRQVAQSPLLLTLLCWVGERQELLPDVTRSQLYDLVMLDLLGLQKGGGVPNLARAKQLLPLMSELALDWFLKNKAKSLIPSEQLIDWIKDFPDRRRPAPINLENGQELNVELAAKLKGSSTEAEYLLGELVAKRLLCFADKNKNVFAFPHRSFVEYLAACALADGLKTEGPSRG